MMKWDEEKKKKKDEERKKKRREEKEQQDWNNSSSSDEDSAPSHHSKTKKKKENNLILQFIKSLQVNTKGLMQEESGNLLRMPMIEVSVFNGDYRKYRAFSETFAEIIDKSRSSNIEKLNMLRMKLTGEALKTIDHLVLVGDNYPKAWKLLRERFTNERKLIDAEIRTLLDLHELAPRSSEAIRSMIDNMREAMANLEIYGLDPLQWDPLVVTILIQPTTSDIEKFLLRRAEKLEVVKTNSNHQQVPQERAHYVNTMVTEGQERRFPKPRQQAFNGRDGAKPFRRNCMICESDEHYALRCPEFINSNDKKAKLWQKKICVYCVKHSFDFQNSCRIRRKLSCDIYRRDHVTEMHPTKQTQAYLCENETATASSEVILPTAIVNLWAKDGTQNPIRALIDQCSQASYINEHVVQKLGLRKQKTSVQITGVGGAAGEVVFFGY